MNTYLLISDTTTFVEEGFETVYVPPAGWTYGSSGCSWASVTAGTHPTVGPKVGQRLLRMDSYTGSSGTSAMLSTPPFSCTGNTGSHNISFWMYHDLEFASREERVDTYSFKNIFLLQNLVLYLHIISNNTDHEVGCK